MTVQTARGAIPELTLGQRLRVAMEWAGHEPADMAEALGRGETTIRNYLAERKPISRGNLVAWAVVCGVDVTWLETGHEGPGDGVHRQGLEPRTRWLSVVRNSPVVHQLTSEDPSEEQAA